ncbi:peptide methionine sulfoxide [Coniella lustricola]|uniref:peptide-methionine (S)-S-oxide reductase n=1 Tax=Coniella lustricola TaxID=2025994 RepID=A0A2T3AA29_9PEZI|nr:peptide methionine sulfoxide [Coniella lustricola]
MVFAMPGFVARLTRPFMTASFLGVVPENGIAAAATIPDGAQEAIVAAGCFWGVEHIYRKHFGDKGLYDARVGYVGGHTKNPTYRAVCSTETGHAEATQLIFDPSRITYAQLIDFFYRIHDPTTKDRQGGDRGSQYRSGIYYRNSEQKKIAEEITAKANAQWYDNSVTTEIVEAGQWWDAEAYHQLYLDKNPSGYQCPTHYVRDLPPLQ